jgi:hypothetical protein
MLKLPIGGNFLALLYRGPVPLVQENVFFRGPQGELFYVERYLGEKVEGVVVYDLAGQLYPRSSFPAVITAKEGRFSLASFSLGMGGYSILVPRGAHGDPRFSGAFPHGWGGDRGGIAGEPYPKRDVHPGAA